MRLLSFWKALLVLTCVVMAFGMTSAQEDGPDELVISVPDFIETATQQQLDLYFNIRARSGSAFVIQPNTIQSAQLTFGTNVYPVEIITPDTPLYIVMILDTSGSMRNAFDQMKAAAILAVDNLPNGANIALITFNETNIVNQQFTTDRNAVKNAILGTSVSNNGTCLYDAVFDGLELIRTGGLDGRSRRAIITFTDGRDEKIAGGELDTCSQKADVNEVLEVAQDRTFPITVHTIGLRGSDPIDETGLRNLADGTGGFVELGGLENLNDLFRRIAQAFSSQRIARAVICEPQGGRSGILTLNLENNLQLADNFTIEVKSGCSPTPTPIAFAMGLDNAVFDPDADQLRIPILKQGGQSADSYRVEVVYKNAGIRVNGDFGSFQVLGDAQEILINTNGIRGDEPLLINVTAVDAQGQAIFETVSKEIALIRPTPTPQATLAPTSTPEPLVLQIDGFVFDAPSDSLSFNVRRTGAGNPTQYRVVIEYSTGIQAAEVIVRADQERITIPTTDIRGSEELNVAVFALDAGGNLLSQGSTRAITLDRPTPTPTATPPVTPTPSPITFTVGDIVYDEAKQELSFPLDHSGGERPVAQYRVRLEYAERGTQAGEELRFSVDAERIAIPTGGLDAEAPLAIKITALDDGGNAIGVTFTSEKQITITRQPTPTPIVTVVNVAISSVTIDESGDNFIVSLNVTPNTEAVKGYTVRVVDESGLQKIENIFTVPPAGQVNISTENIENGEYTLSVELNVPDQTPSPAASTSLTFTRPEAPAKPPIEWVKDNIVSVGVGLFGLLLLIIILVLLVRRRGKGKNNVPVVLGRITSDDGTVTMVGELEQSLASIDAVLMIVRAPGQDPNRRYEIVSSPYRIGRGGGKYVSQLMLDADSRISRDHLRIEREGDAYAFYDEGSANGTWINNERLGAGVAYRVKLGQSATLRLGQNTEIRFESIEQKRGYASEVVTNVDEVGTQVDMSTPSSDDEPTGVIPMSATDELVSIQNTLEVYELQADGRRTPVVSKRILESHFTIGKASENVLSLDIQGISRQHAVIVYNGQTFTIEDQNSTNGTWMHDKRLPTQQPVWLAPNVLHEIRLGSRVILVFTWYTDNDEGTLKTPINKNGISNDDDDNTEVES